MTDRVLGLFFVLASVMLEAFGNIFFKQAAELNSANMRPLVLLRTVWQDKNILAGITCFIFEIMLWTLALSHLPVSIAFPAGSMSFVFVAVLAYIFFREQVDALRWTGVALIIGGVILVGLK